MRGVEEGERLLTKDSEATQAVACKQALEMRTAQREGKKKEEGKGRAGRQGPSPFSPALNLQTEAISFSALPSSQNVQCTG